MFNLKKLRIKYRCWKLGHDWFTPITRDKKGMPIQKESDTECIRCYIKLIEIKENQK